ncbi:hypothetical protein LUZ60_003178 [Juncus effusus]|nr:hypothetical protein LUZ60_003178 [Juncus effusus]
MRFLDSSLHDSIKVLTEQPILITTCCSLAVRAHDSSSASPFVVHSLTNPYPCAIFAFSGAWTADEWLSGGKPPFGETEVDPSVFPSLRSVGSGVIARVNASFLSSFERLVVYSTLQSEVSKAISEGKRVIFTGHSSGGAIAVLAAVWLLENHAKSAAHEQFHPCITFGAPLIGDSVFNHALEREGWSHNFLHFIISIDIIPRILLSPVSTYNYEIQTVLNFLSPKASNFGLESIQRSNLVPSFYESVLKNSLSVSSYQACGFMGCTNSLMGTLTSFVVLSPYRPFGTCVFLTSEGRVIVTKNSDAILQLLFYFMQLNPHEQFADVAYRSLNEHWLYESKLKDWILRNGEGLSFIISESDLDGSAFSDLKLGKEAKLRLCAAMKWHKQRQTNQLRIDANCTKIHAALNSLNKYRTTCELKGISYYDSFKLQKNIEDFNANVKRIELAGLWDEIVEMLRRNELPDCFENRAEWVNLGTVYRRLVEPLDIANYYRHGKNEDTGSYLLKGRPRRYRYTQRWHEQAQRKEMGSSSESCFWAVIEELQFEMGNNKTFVDVRERLVNLELQMLNWLRSGSIGPDVFFKYSSFVVWWKTLPEQHRMSSCVLNVINGDSM